MSYFLALNLGLLALGAVGGYLVVPSAPAKTFRALIFWQFIFMAAAGTHISGSPLPAYWMSSLQQLFVCALCFPLLAFSRSEIGLVLPRGKTAWTWSLILLLVGIALGGMATFITKFEHGVSQQETPSFEASVWHALMPGITEEFAYRGLSLALLQRGIAAEERSRGLAMAGIVTTLLFAAQHVTPYDGAEWVFINVVRVGFALVAGTMLFFVRVRTGSLLAGMVVHNATNIARDMLVRLAL